MFESRLIPLSCNGFMRCRHRPTSSTFILITWLIELMVAFCMTLLEIKSWFLYKHAMALVFRELVLSWDCCTNKCKVDGMTSLANGVSRISTTLALDKRHKGTLESPMMMPRSINHDHDWVRSQATESVLCCRWCRIDKALRQLVFCQQNCQRSRHCCGQLWWCARR